MSKLYYVEVKGYGDSEDKCDTRWSPFFDSYSKAFKCWQDECLALLNKNKGWLKGVMSPDGTVNYAKYLAYRNGDEKKEEKLEFYIRLKPTKPAYEVKTDYFAKVNLIVDEKEEKGDKK